MLVDADGGFSPELLWLPLAGAVEMSARMRELDRCPHEGIRIQPSRDGPSLRLNLLATPCLLAQHNAAPAFPLLGQELPNTHSEMQPLTRK